MSPDTCLFCLRYPKSKGKRKRRKKGRELESRDIARERKEIQFDMVSKNLKKEPCSRSSSTPNPFPSRNSNFQKQAPPGDVSLPPVTIGEDECLRTASRLERAEVLRRRWRRLHQLASIYKRHYWSLIEDLRIKHRDYYWEHGKSPLEKRKLKGQESTTEDEEGTGGERMKCAFSGCKAKAMALTRFCHQHILADPKQTLYKPCNFVIKRYYILILVLYLKLLVKYVNF
jgi:Potential DNA-binding domain